MAKKKDEERFEVLVERVEEALRELESGELPLEEAMKRYEAGVAALRRCYAILKQAEAKVQVLAEREGEAELADFDPEDEPGKDAGRNRLF